jgi:hypothetical protein
MRSAFSERVRVCACLLSGPWGAGLNNLTCLEPGADVWNLVSMHLHYFVLYPLEPPVVTVRSLVSSSLVCQ